MLLFWILIEYRYLLFLFYIFNMTMCWINIVNRNDKQLLWEFKTEFTIDNCDEETCQFYYYNFMQAKIIEFHNRIFKNSKSHYPLCISPRFFKSMGHRIDVLNYPVKCKIAVPKSNYKNCETSQKRPGIYRICSNYAIFLFPLLATSVRRKPALLDMRCSHWKSQRW